MSQEILFKDLNLPADILEAIEQKGFTQPTPIQAAVIPLLLSGEHDVIGQAQTGTGKTAAFGLPLLSNIKPEQGQVKALILAPTRELAQQVTQELISLKGERRLFIDTLYGGASIGEQIRNLKKGIDIVVGTPGRIQDHLRRGTLKLGHVEYVVLDEADEMLNMGFIEDVETILDQVNPNRRMLLFSATMPAAIKKLAQRFAKNPQHIAVVAKITANLTTQSYYEIGGRDKLKLLKRLLDIHGDFHGIVFCQTKADTDEVAQRLAEAGYAAEPIHGDLNQTARESVLRRFRSGATKVLVATDVAARGIDVSGLTHVVNYAVPRDSETYTHRIGRTGRAGKEGLAITFVAPSERRSFRFIEKKLEGKITKQEIPSAKEVLKARRRRLHNFIQEQSDKGGHEEYENFARKLIEEYGAEQTVAGVLKMAFQESLATMDDDHIQEIVTSNDRFDRRSGGRAPGGRSSNGRSPRSDVLRKKQRGQHRIMIDLHGQRLNKPKLVDFVSQRSQVPGRFIDDLSLEKDKAFFSVSERDLGKVVDNLKDHNVKVIR